ncbi:unnamed protein product [Albugo candida]|uniref:Uncharacterized protein n=1 Tax=Albugo candida TaxID=65357 RepID=A0A024GJ03_9STRA|nr:unnamed protein product [Albugo candida]|eukprot:CCI46745.1 unnamed protein product [Albugo candida]
MMISSNHRTTRRWTRRKYCLLKTESLRSELLCLVVLIIRCLMVKLPRSESTHQVSQLCLILRERRNLIDSNKQTSQSNFPPYAWNRDTLVHVINERSPRSYELDDCLESESVHNHSIPQPNSTYYDFDQMTFSSLPIDHSIEKTTAYDSPSTRLRDMRTFIGFSVILIITQSISQSLFATRSPCMTINGSFVALIKKKTLRYK